MGILLSFSILYIIPMLSIGLSVHVILIYVFHPICFYIFGYRVAISDFNFKKSTRLIFIVIASSTLYGLFSLIKTILTYGSMSNAMVFLHGRLVLDMWGTRVIAATGINTTISLGLALLPILFLSGKGLKGSKKIKMLSIIFFTISLFIATQLANRTALVIIITSFVVTLLFAERISLKKITKFILLGGLLFLIRVIYTANFLGIKESWESTLLFSRFNISSLSEDPRLEGWKAAFLGLFEYPLGGRKADIKLSFAHNLWLDVGYDSGIPAIVLLLIFTVVSLVVLIRFVRNNPPVIFKGLVISLYVSFLISFSIEPIIQGWFSYFTLFCCLVGIIQRMNFNYRVGQI